MPTVSVSIPTTKNASARGPSSAGHSASRRRTRPATRRGAAAVMKPRRLRTMAVLKRWVGRGSVKREQSPT
eukprot:scaffold109035_cov32-Tisochrysis_lutea.AAC.2